MIISFIYFKKLDILISHKRENTQYLRKFLNFSLLVNILKPIWVNFWKLLPLPTAFSLTTYTIVSLAKGGWEQLERLCGIYVFVNLLSFPCGSYFS